MYVRSIIFVCLLTLAAFAQAKELPTALFSRTPDAGPVDIAAPRALAVDSAANRCFVLDSGLNRVIALTPDGESMAVWPLAAKNIDLSRALPPDPLLPTPALAYAQNTLYLLSPDRQQGLLDIAVIDGPGTARTVRLPEHANYGAFTLDADGRTLGAYLQVTDGKLELVLAREINAGTLTTVGTLPDPCEGIVKNLDITGFAAAPDGRVAIGIAQSGDPAYSFTRSWLVEGTALDTAVTEKLHLTHRVTLLDQRGKLQERYRPLAAMAGSAGYPAKPCVHLFTSLALGPDGLLVSGGYTADPFLRIYDKDGRLLRTLPWQATGGQHVAILADKWRPRIFALDGDGARVQEVALDGRILGGFGRPLPYDLTQVLALTADNKNVYAAARWNERLHLLRFTAEGRFVWAIQIDPPRGMAKAQPFLTMPSNDRVLIGWRQPQTAGLGWVDTVMEDGTAGMPLWTQPYTSQGTAKTLCPTPLLADRGRTYVLREQKDGTALQAMAITGTFLMQYPAAIQGISFVDTQQNLAWAHADADGLIIGRFTPQGADHGWKRVPRATPDAELLPVSAGEYWGWLSTTHSLVQLDETMTVTDEAVLTTPDAHPIDGILAITGDHAQHIYLALPDRLLVIDLPAAEK